MVSGVEWLGLMLKSPQKSKWCLDSFMLLRFRNNLRLIVFFKQLEWPVKLFMICEMQKCSWFLSTTTLHFALYISVTPCAILWKHVHWILKQQCQQQITYVLRYTLLLIKIDDQNLYQIKPAAHEYCLFASFGHQFLERYVDSRIWREWTTSLSWLNPSRAKQKKDFAISHT